MAASIAELTKIISESISLIERTCKESGASAPNLSDPMSRASEAWRANPDAAEASNIAVAAAHQLLGTLQSPLQYMFQIVGGFHLAQCLWICAETNCVEILREAGPQGLHVDKIAALAGVDSKKLVRFLRFCATNHIFKEVKPNVFTNTRLAGLMDTGKSVAELRSNPSARIEGNSGTAPVLGHIMDESFKGAAYALETIKDPVTAFSDEPEHCPISRAFNTNLSMWDWLELPENEYRLRRFGQSMKALEAQAPAESVLHGFDWKALGKNDLIVDVAGGIGSVSLAIATATPDVNIVIQDQLSVVQEGIKFWQKELPDALDSGRVKLEARDLFKEQPIKNASVFLLRRILHDWSDKYSLKILKLLREAATPATKLLVIDARMRYACHDPSADGEDAIPGSTLKEAPEPLLPNYGIVSTSTYVMDLAMFFNCNAQERTLAHLTELLRESGWRVTRVYPDPRGLMNQTEAVPI